jgi:hypothetical protein
LGQCLLDIAKGLGELRIEIAGERTSIIGNGSSVTRDPNNNLLTLRDDGRRKGAGLLPRPGYK